MQMPTQYRQYMMYLSVVVIGLAVVELGYNQYKSMSKSKAPTE